MVGSQRTTTLRYQVGMGNLVTIGSIDEGIDTVVDILLNTVVDTTLTRRRTGSIVVNTQSTTAIHKVNIITHLMQLHIELRSLAQSRLNATNLRYLATNMEMNQAQAVAHILLIQHVQCF